MLESKRNSSAHSTTAIAENVYFVFVFLFSFYCSFWENLVSESSLQSTAVESLWYSTTNITTWTCKEIQYITVTAVFFYNAITVEDFFANLKF